MATVTINIYYDANPPFTPRTQRLVNDIFDACFASLEKDSVVIVWILGAPPNPPGKGWATKTTLNYQLRSTLGAGLGADGATAGAPPTEATDAGSGATVVSGSADTSRTSVSGNGAATGRAPPCPARLR